MRENTLGRCWLLIAVAFILLRLATVTQVSSSSPRIRPTDSVPKPAVDLGVPTIRRLQVPSVGGSSMWAKRAVWTDQSAGQARAERPGESLTLDSQVDYDGTICP